jgi:hypothetical protein
VRATLHTIPQQGNGPTGVRGYYTARLSMAKAYGGMECRTLLATYVVDVALANSSRGVDRSRALVELRYSFGRASV